MEFYAAPVFWRNFVLKPQKDKDALIVSVSTRDESIENLLSKEWLLTNERGSYACSTTIGCNTRRYHGLLIGSLNPPVDRIMALSNCMESVVSNLASPEPEVVDLSTFEFSDRFAPAGFGYIKRFYQDIGVHFDYELSNVALTKSIYLLRKVDTVAIVYNFLEVSEELEFVLRPFVGLRDFHTLQKSYAPLIAEWFGPPKAEPGRLLVKHNISDSCELFLCCPAGLFKMDQQWWFNFVYRNDKERGQNFTEDLWTPGFFRCRIEKPTKLIFWANLSSPKVDYRPKAAEGGWDQARLRRVCDIDIDTVKEELYRHQSQVTSNLKSKDSQFKKLCLAADQFIVRRISLASRLPLNVCPSTPSDEQRVTILAGYPWFADWGRDAFISLPGLLLATGRFEEARSVLITFAQAADDGMIPNRFDDRSDTAYFNSVDASFWFINSAFGYLDATCDLDTFTQNLLPVICWIIDSYNRGTRFDIHADIDGLITAGSIDTQLTWMDAKYDGIAFTPRWAKAVEVNALWYNCLCLISKFYSSRPPKAAGIKPANGGAAAKLLSRPPSAAEPYRSMADKAGSSFCRLFWNEQCGYLNDTVMPDGSVDMSLRPNQIFAVSLPFSPPLSVRQQRSIVEVIEKELLTPYGLRTLNVQNENYKWTYIGPQRQRDQAYHQGTVWPYLIGPFVEAYLRVNNFSQESKKKAAEFIQPLLWHLTEQACLGSISEIFDGDAPHKPRGCIAQAWSVAELIRAYQLINS
jgi:predicted glycogen debranching enzyme